MFPAGAVKADGVGVSKDTARTRLPIAIAWRFFWSPRPRQDRPSLSRRVWPGRPGGTRTGVCRRLPEPTLRHGAQPQKRPQRPETPNGCQRACRSEAFLDPTLEGGGRLRPPCKAKPEATIRGHTTGGSGVSPRAAVLRRSALAVARALSSSWPRSSAVSSRPLEDGASWSGSRSVKAFLSRVGRSAISHEEGCAK